MKVRQDAVEVGVAVIQTGNGVPVPVPRGVDAGTIDGNAKVDAEVVAATTTGADRGVGGDETGVKVGAVVVRALEAVETGAAVELGNTSGFVSAVPAEAPEEAEDTDGDLVVFALII
ncbi:hypothetical protein HDU93_005851 [Gonapodya sp. JEL0774]|nr:hypothetical protein HDU93_005851 [Gonapodya sp. JEL0774]